MFNGKKDKVLGCELGLCGSGQSFVIGVFGFISLGKGEGNVHWFWDSKGLETGFVPRN